MTLTTRELLTIQVQKPEAIRELIVHFNPEIAEITSIKATLVLDGLTFSAFVNPPLEKVEQHHLMSSFFEDVKQIPKDGILRYNNPHKGRKPMAYGCIFAD